MSIHISIYFLFYLIVYLSIYIYLPIYLSIFLLVIFLSICLFICLSICLVIFLSICLSIIYLSIYHINLQGEKRDTNPYMHKKIFSVCILMLLGDGINLLIHNSDPLFYMPYIYSLSIGFAVAGGDIFS